MLIAVMLEFTPMNEINWTDVIVAVAGFWGAILSSIIFLRDFLKDKSKLQVKTSLCLLGYPDGSNHMNIEVKAINIGKIPIVLSSVHIRMPDGKNYIQLNSPNSPQLPYDLLPQKSYSYFFNAKDLAAKMKEHGYSEKIYLMPYYTDQIDKKHRSKRYRFDLGLNF